MKKLCFLGICASLIGISACDNDSSDNNKDTKAALGAECQVADDCESNYCNESGICAEAPTDEIKKEDGEKCSKADECKSGKCEDGQCGAKADEEINPCKDKADDTECGENKVCKAEACVDKEGGEDDPCKGKADDTECGENKVCKSEACVDKEGGEDDPCKGKADDTECGENKVCKSEACVDKEGGSIACKNETDCPDSHAYECIEGACVVKPLPCEGKEDGTECGENKVCKSEVCVDKEGGEDDPCKGKADDTECGENKVCKSEVCVDKGEPDPSQTDYPPCAKKGDVCGKNQVCDANLKCIDERCSEGKDPCATTDKPYCHIVEDQVVCSIVENCGTNETMNADGKCEPTLGLEGAACTTSDECAEGLTCHENHCASIALGGEGEACTTSSDCQAGLACYENYCTSAVVSLEYRYVRIEDLSPTCEAGKCGSDPGADIDAIVLLKAGDPSHAIYASSVIGYQRSDGMVASTTDNTNAANPSKAIGAPDAFVHFPTADQCDYYEASVPGNDTINRQYTFVSLGGVGGYLSVEMAEAIEAGDVLNVLELGACQLFNTTDKPNALSTTAKAENIRVSISTTTDGVWKLVGSGQGDSTNHGILSFNITSGIL